MQIEKMIVISTGHLTEKVAEILDEAAMDAPPYCELEWAPAFTRDHGWLFHVPKLEDMLETDPPECLRNIFAFARAAGCDWVMLDSDGERVEGMPWHEW